MILVAEDQPVFQQLYALILDKLGYPYIMAVDGKEALEKAQKHKPALIFMDIEMPVMNGYESAEELRKSGFENPIIAVTANETLDEEQSKKAGISDLLVKPIKPIEVEKVLLKWLEGDTSEVVSGTSEVVCEQEAEVEEKSSAQKEIFDSDYMLHTFMNNETLALSLLSRFITRTQDQMESLQKIEKDENWESGRQIAHMLKGAANTMGAAELGKAAARMEKACTELNKSEFEAAFPPLQNSFELFKKAAENFITSRS